MHFEELQDLSGRTITYGSLALAGPAPLCRERPADGYRCRPAPDVAPVSPAPINPASISSGLILRGPISHGPSSPGQISPQPVSPEPISLAPRPGSGPVLHSRELAVRLADAVALSLCAAREALSVPLTRVAAATRRSTGSEARTHPVTIRSSARRSRDRAEPFHTG